VDGILSQTAFKKHPQRRQSRMETGFYTPLSSYPIGKTLSQYAVGLAKYFKTIIRQDPRPDYNVSQKGLGLAPSIPLFSNLFYTKQPNNEMALRKNLKTKI